MWGFWWIFPVIGLLIFLFFLFFVFSVVLMVRGGGHFMCIGPHHHDSEETARFRRELEELREQVKKQAAAR
jgi:hypothetical protein